MAVYQQQLVKQYTSLSSLMTSLNNTSSYLTQAMDALNNVSTSKG
jgi:flagellar hook-associated protein 2